MDQNKTKPNLSNYSRGRWGWGEGLTSHYISEDVLECWEIAALCSFQNFCHLSDLWISQLQDLQSKDGTLNQSLIKKHCIPLRISRMTL